MEQLVKGMHPYATNPDERRYILVALVVLGILAAYGLHTALSTLQISAPWWLEVPSFLGFYGLLYVIFDRHLWKNRLVRRLGNVRTPNLNGTWDGHLTSSFDDGATKHEGTIKITQTWTRMGVTLEAQQSRSHSVVATFVIDDTDTVLTYEYLNEPMSQAKKTMHIHRGTAWLFMQPDSDTLQGRYYSGRGRQNFGSLRFTRVR